MTDYAQHLIKIDTLSKTAHDACLEKNWPAVRKNANDILAEARLLYWAARELQNIEEQKELARTK